MHPIYQQILQLIESKCKWLGDWCWVKCWYKPTFQDLADFLNANQRFSNDSFHIDSAHFL